MNYQNHYDKLMNRARGRTLKGYTEKHHIVPRCMGGSDKKANIVVLTAEEHYVAHQLLVKMHPGNQKILYSATQMTKSPHGHRSNNKLYGWLQQKFSENQSNSRWITNGEENKRLYFNEEMPIGWEYGVTRLERSAMILINDGKTQKLIDANSDIPEGWFKGKIGCSLAKDTIWINDGFNSKMISKDSPLPEGWNIGRYSQKKVKITNGLTDRLITKGEPVPEGWVLGSPKRGKGREKWVNNGKENKRIAIGDDVPEGWECGVIRDKGKANTSIRITNGSQNKNISKYDTIPEGWRRGVTRHN